MFCLLPFERNLYQNYKKEEKILWNQNAKARFETLKIKILQLPPFVLYIYGEFMALNQKDPMLFL